MLGKTANGLYWMFRYIERAENTARLIETGQRISLTRTGGGEGEGEWGSILHTADAYDSFMEHHDEVTRDTAIDWLLRAADNSSSVRSCINAARQNARLVRTALTSEVWEAVNGTFMVVKETLARKVSERELPSALGTIRQQAGLVRGATHGTMLRNDIYDFARIGTFLERGDNTARILDVKYYVLLPSVHAVGSNIDNVQWETILRSVSGRGGYRMAFGDQISPRDIAQFLILDGRMPRSLYFCATKLQTNLGYLAADYGQKGESQDTIEKLVGQFMSHDIDSIFDIGLHEYIQSVLGSFGQLGMAIERDYRFYE